MSITISIKHNEDELIKNTVERHEKKLQEITESQSIPFTSNEVITNLSSYTLSSEEEDLLIKGLDYAIPPYKLRKTDIFYSYELIYRFISSNK